MGVGIMNEKRHKCIRCGHCCMAVGRAFWCRGDFFRWPELQERAERTVDEGDGLPCEMLILENGIASCKIELEYGREAKPAVCRNYSENLCHQQAKLFQGQGVCYLVSG